MAGPPLLATVLRGLQDAALLSLLGALGVRLLLPPDARLRVARPFGAIALASGALALVLAVAWFLAEAANVSEVAGAGPILGSVPAFVAFLPFGRFLLLRIALLALAVLLLATGRWKAALGLTVAAVLLQPWLGHAAEVGAGLTISEMLHLVAGGAWFGSLLPLLACLRRLALADAQLVLRRFTLVGVVLVLTVAGTGLAQAFALAGGLHGLAATSYGRIALAKAGLLAVAALLGARNGLWLTPRLLRQARTAAQLRAAVVAEAAIGFAIMMLAGWLAMSAP